MASLRSFELTIRGPNDLIECDFPSMISRGDFFPQLETLSLSMSHDHRFESFIPLLVLCPRVQDLTISVDAYQQPSLPSFGRLVNLLPNGVALKRLAIGLRMWNGYLLLMTPTTSENESYDKCLAIIVQTISAQRLRPFKIILNEGLIEQFDFPQVSEACHSRRIAFGVAEDPSPGMSAWKTPPV